MLYAREYGVADTMNAFIVHLQSATQYEEVRDIVSFSGADASGGFSLWAGHARFVTVLVLGLANLRHADGRTEYLATPGAVVYFDRNVLTISCRRYLRGDDFMRISTALREELAREENEMAEFKQSLARIERAMLVRLWRMDQRGAPL